MDKPTKFAREFRYWVFKDKDVRACLTLAEQQEILRLRLKVNDYRKTKGKSNLMTVVVESDWPEYEPVWKMIEERMTAKPAVKTEPEITYWRGNSGIYAIKGSVIVNRVVTTIPDEASPIGMVVGSPKLFYKETTKDDYEAAKIPVRQPDSKPDSEKHPDDCECAGCMPHSVCLPVSEKANPAKVLLTSTAQDYGLTIDDVTSEFSIPASSVEIEHKNTVGKEP